MAGFSLSAICSAKLLSMNPDFVALPEETRDFDGPHGRIPVLIPRSQPARGAILFYHGLTGHKEEHRADFEVWNRVGFSVWSVDAPHHGNRKDAHFDAMMRAFDENSPEHAHLFWSLVEEALDEIPALLDQIGPDVPVGVAGFSMGGMISFSALQRFKRIQAAVPVNSSPSRWTKIETAQTQRVKSLAPLHFPGEFAPRALLAINSRLDEVVRPETARSFIEDLRPFYKDEPDKLAYFEFDQSPHWLRDEDWSEYRILARDWFGKWLV